MRGSSSVSGLILGLIAIVVVGGLWASAWSGTFAIWLSAGTD